MSKSFKQSICEAAYGEKISIEAGVAPGFEQGVTIHKYRVLLYGNRPFSGWYVDPTQAWSEAFDKVIKIMPRVVYADSTAFQWEMGNTAKSRYILHDYPMEVVVLSKDFFDKLVQLIKEQ